MSDFLLELSKNPQTRGLVRSLGLPIPLPEPLRRDAGPWLARPLADRRVLVGATEGAELVGALAECLAAAGADAWLSMPEPLAGLFTAPGETFARPAHAVSAFPEGKTMDALVFDASGVRDVAGLRALFDFFQPVVSRISRSGRVLVLGRPDEGGAAEAAAAQGALEGFVRSVAKEIGRGGATANLVLV
jgi:3-oxoacyl-[acyl-carrier protein] reductase